MHRTSDSERESFRQAAEIATARIPKLQAKQKQLAEQITAFQSMIDAYEMLCGKRRPATGENGTGDQELPARKKPRAKKGIVTEQIEEALGDSSLLEVVELRDKIERIHGKHYGRSTIYTALNRGEGTKFQRQGNKWRMNPLVLVNRAS
jgi:hypothetical protein